MGGLERGASWWWNYFSQLFFDVHKSIKGHIVLGYGMQTLSIPIDDSINPIDVYINCVDNDVPVCIGSVSMATAVLNDDNTFTLIANVQSNSCTVSWFIEYQPLFN